MFLKVQSYKVTFVTHHYFRSCRLLGRIVQFRTRSRCLDRILLRHYPLLHPPTQRQRVPSGLWSSNSDYPHLCWNWLSCSDSRQPPCHDHHDHPTSSLRFSRAKTLRDCSGMLQILVSRPLQVSPGSYKRWILSRSSSLQPAQRGDVPLLGELYHSLHGLRYHRLFLSGLQRCGSS